MNSKVFAWTAFAISLIALGVVAAIFINSSAGTGANPPCVPGQDPTCPPSQPRQFSRLVAAGNCGLTDESIVPNISPEDCQRRNDWAYWESFDGNTRIENSAEIPGPDDETQPLPDESEDPGQSAVGTCFYSILGKSKSYAATEPDCLDDSNSYAWCPGEVSVVTEECNGLLEPPDDETLPR